MIQDDLTSHQVSNCANHCVCLKWEGRGRTLETTGPKHCKTVAGSWRKSNGLDLSKIVPVAYGYAK